MEDWEHIMNVLNHHNSEIIKDYKNIVNKRSRGFSLVLLGGMYMMLPLWGIFHNWAPAVTIILMFCTFIFLTPYSIILFRTDETIKKLSMRGWVPTTTDLVFLDKINMILIVITSFVQGSVALLIIFTKFPSDTVLLITGFFIMAVGPLFVYLIKKNSEDRGFLFYHTLKGYVDEIADKIARELNAEKKLIIKQQQSRAYVVRTGDGTVIYVRSKHPGNYTSVELSINKENLAKIEDVIRRIESIAN